MTKLLRDFYGKEDLVDKSALYVALVTFILGIIFSIVLKLNVGNHGRFSFIASIYILSLFFSFSFFIISLHLFSKRVEKRYLRWVQYLFLIVSIIILAIAFLPLTIFQIFSDYTRFKNLPRYFVVYIFIYALTSLLDFFIFPCILWWIKMYGNEVINIFLFTIIITYFINLAISYMFLRLYFIYKKSKFQDLFKLRIEIDYKQSKKELYVINYLIILVISFLIYIVKVPDDTGINIYKTFNDGMLYAFTLFITFDTLKDKWNNILNNQKDLLNLVLQDLLNDLFIVQYQIKNYKLTNCSYCRGKMKFRYSINELSIIFSPRIKNKKIAEIYNHLLDISNKPVDFIELEKRVEELQITIQALGE